jgi:CheY-like chemotaxis protein
MLPTATVLLVDDSEPQRYAIRRELAAAGHTVLEAGTGNDALLVARELPQVILLDVNLPDIDGFEVCRRLKQDPHTASIPVIFISAISEPWEAHGPALAAGGSGFLIQPVDITQLLTVIAGAVEKARIQNDAA